MPLIIHHNDDDGRCSAAIIYNELCIDKPMGVENFIEYGHGGEVPKPDVENMKDGDTVYIVDLSLDNVIFSVIKNIRETNPNVNIVHIDHHKTTIDFMNDIDSEKREIMDHVHKFHRIGLSASMLCWTYVSMNEEQREHIEDQENKFDFTDGFSHVGFDIGKPDERVVRVPMAVRFIDDWDVWRHEISGSTEFHFAFSMAESKHPMEKIWSDLFYNFNDYVLVDKYINPGTTILKYNESEYRHLMKHAFEYTLQYGDKRVKMLCLNAFGSSKVFGDMIKLYPAVCLFQYYGDTGLWHYSLYCDESSDVDVSEICKHFGGGGHRCASGITSPEYLFK